MVLDRGPGYGRGERHPVLPRPRGAKRHLGAQGAFAAQQHGRRRRSSARADGLPVHAGSRQAQGCDDSVVRAGAGGRTHERHRHRTPRAASQCRAAFLRFHALDRGAGIVGVYGIRADPCECALAARPAAFHAGGPGGRVGPERQVGQVLRGGDTQAGWPVMKRVFIALVFAVSPAAHTVHSQTLQKLATYQGEDRQQRLVEGARKEGSLLFYATFPIEYADQLIEPFRSKYGIRVDVWRARSEIVLRKVIAEARAGGPSADVIAIISPQEEALRRENLLQEIHSPYHKDLVPAAVPAHREWVSTLHHVFVDRKSTRLNSSHSQISYAVFCLKKKKHRLTIYWTNWLSTHY